ncbi:hypothetical protein ABZ722_00905 [Streptomyces longwoodensis]|uniref:hypothetical protein n=1 Tax=Streptomyces longwoodensis TaxID=68231 RepID=UPI0033EC71D9
MSTGKRLRVFKVVQGCCENLHRFHYGRRHALPPELTNHAEVCILMHNVVTGSGEEQRK